ncbi:uncharacterized protein MONOS_1524 [Monocercomonoides exilis]|uniref:uncharacterized protein n=1 Tax=Monocercomonoides exilis TaxID=2049356 RepID=UPI00355A3A3F|nr:hypothetical protein MONOS_1524 [Monocercomonoides exilis]|eukprot:MONOS_1524.1-p1 / transcript=MONOS_1524.1 / gene=MONOS_1524 / organism=Monocercomonoides_exilis_PA203 / gene_product=unspecified product / transcript_product=unspecified product / location=Mono_scaffold00027:69484-70386(-) / protein_length=301 / sequence_SO=supercontig / SO=protein_coding / is_pseudo=false
MKSGLILLKEINSRSLETIVNRRNREAELDITHEIQSDIHPDLFFKRNSVNLLVGGRGSGKTYSVLKELAKVSALDELYQEYDVTPELHFGGYSLFVYVSDKSSDQTFERMKKFIEFPIVQVRYNEALKTLTDISNAKELYRDIYNRKQQDESVVNAVLETLHIDDFSQPVHHTAVLFDDCMEMFKKKDGIFRLLFENRQPMITYFLCLQDPKGICSEVKANLDTLWIFGGFSKLKFNYVYYQLQTYQDRDALWEGYKNLSRRDIMHFSYDDDGTKIKTIIYAKKEDNRTSLNVRYVRHL